MIHHEGKLLGCSMKCTACQSFAPQPAFALTQGVTAAAVFYLAIGGVCYAALGNATPGMVLDGFQDDAGGQGIQHCNEPSCLLRMG